MISVLEDLTKKKYLNEVCTDPFVFGLLSSDTFSQIVSMTVSVSEQCDSTGGSKLHKAVLISYM